MDWSEPWKKFSREWLENEWPHDCCYPYSCSYVKRNVKGVVECHAPNPCEWRRDLVLAKLKGESNARSKAVG